MFALDFFTALRTRNASTHMSYGVFFAYTCIPLFVIHSINSYKICLKCKDRIELKVSFLSLGYESIVGGLSGLIFALFFYTNSPVAISIFLAINIIIMFIVNESASFMRKIVLLSIIAIIFLIYYNVYPDYNLFDTYNNIK